MDKKLGYIPSAVNEPEESKLHLWNSERNIHLEGLSGNATIQIIDITGRIIKSEQAQDNYTTILKQGVYMIRISDEANKYKVLKCIVHW